MSIKFKSILAVFLLSIGLLFALYSDVLLHLNEVLFCNSGDGFKNYYNFLFHIKHDPNYLTFDGMNYPYGELIFLVDLHPLFANSLKFFCANIYDISYYGVGMLNFCMLFSLPVAAVFLFLIFHHYRCAPIPSIIAALGVTFLCSTAVLWQHGHYALSYVCFFPIGWYLIIKYLYSAKKMTFTVLIFLNTLFWFYTHNYLGLILLAFNACVFSFNWVFYSDTRKWMNVLHFLIQVVLPAIIVVSFIKLLDHHDGRIEMPYLYHYRASLSSVFLPNVSPFKPLFEGLHDYSHLKTELWSRVGNYVGISTSLVFIGFIFYTVYIFLKGKAVKTEFSREWLVFLLSATLLLVYSFAFPFRYDLEFLLPTTLKQFVNLGRFAWVFYFVITVFSIVLLNTIVAAKWRSVLLTLTGSLLLLEGMAVHQDIHNKISVHTSPFNDSTFDEVMESKEKSIDFSDYQAILPIPFYHEYTGLGTMVDDEKVKRLSMQLSLRTGMPLMSAMLSRNSVNEAKYILQLFTPSFIEKPIQNTLNHQPLLIIYSKNEPISLEKELLEKATLVYSNTEFELYKLELSSVFKNNSSDLIQELNLKVDQYKLDTLTQFYQSNSVKMIYNSFDSTPTDFQYRGNGSFKKRKTEFGLVFDGQTTKFTPNIPYSISFWYYNDVYDQYFNSVWLEVKNEKGEILRTEFINPCSSRIVDGDWALTEMNFQLDSDNEYIMLCSQGSKEYADSVYFDELLIRPTDVEVFKYSKDINQIIWNNYSLQSK